MQSVAIKMPQKILLLSKTAIESLKPRRRIMGILPEREEMGKDKYHKKSKKTELAMDKQDDAGENSIKTAKFKWDNVRCIVHHLL